jgi:hypothetical protein
MPPTYLIAALSFLLTAHRILHWLPLLLHKESQLFQSVTTWQMFWRSLIFKTERWRAKCQSSLALHVLPA